MSETGEVKLSWLQRLRESRVAFIVSYLVGFAFMGYLIINDYVGSSSLHRSGIILVIFIVILGVPLFYSPVGDKEDY